MVPLSPSGDRKPSKGPDDGDAGKRPSHNAPHEYSIASHEPRVDSFKEEDKRRESLLDDSPFSLQCMKDLEDSLEPLTTDEDEGFFLSGGDKTSNAPSTIADPVSTIAPEPVESHLPYVDELVNLVYNHDTNTPEDSQIDPLSSLSLLNGSPISLSPASSSVEGANNESGLLLDDTLNTENTIDTSLENILKDPLPSAVSPDLTIIPESTAGCPHYPTIDGKEEGGKHPLIDLHAAEIDVVDLGKLKCTSQEKPEDPLGTGKISAAVKPTSQLEDEGSVLPPVTFKQNNSDQRVERRTIDEEQEETQDTIENTKKAKGVKRKKEKEGRGSSNIGDVEDLMQKPQKRKQAKFLKPIASRYCHICARTPKTVSNVVCAKMKTGYCRKVVCEKCFNDYGWDWKAANEPNSNWVCPHCLGKCPKRAQCHTYSKTNNRLRVKRIIEKKSQRNAKRRPQPAAPSLILPAPAKNDPLVAPWIVRNLMMPPMEAALQFAPLPDPTCLESTQKPSTTKTPRQDHQEPLGELDLSQLFDSQEFSIDTSDANVYGPFVPSSLMSATDTDLEYP